MTDKSLSRIKNNFTEISVYVYPCLALIFLSFIGCSSSPLAILTTSVTLPGESLLPRYATTVAVQVKDGNQFPQLAEILKENLNRQQRSERINKFVPIDQTGDVSLLVQISPIIQIQREHVRERLSFPGNLAHQEVIEKEKIIKKRLIGTVTLLIQDTLSQVKIASKSFQLNMALETSALERAEKIAKQITEKFRDCQSPQPHQVRLRYYPLQPMLQAWDISSWQDWESLQRDITREIETRRHLLQDALLVDKNELRELAYHYYNRSQILLLLQRKIPAGRDLRCYQQLLDHISYVETKY